LELFSYLVKPQDVGVIFLSKVAELAIARCLGMQILKNPHLPSEILLFKSAPYKDSHGISLHFNFLLFSGFH